MASSNTYVSTNGAAVPQCTCGGAQAEAALSCLVHPRFFCGQLLTDQDLNALLSWTQGKFRLRRRLQGWGIACGFEVSRDPANSSGVLVTAGYALDDCGNDVLLCNGGSLSLADACAIAATNCLELPASHSSARYGRDREVLQPGKPPLQVEERGKAAAANSLRTVDVLVRYKALPGEPLPALGRGACSERGACEPSRVAESFELFWREADDFSDPQRPALEMWEARYFSRGREVVDKVVEAARKGGSYNYFERFELIKRILLEWLERYPPQRLCFLSEAVERLSQKSEFMPIELARVLGWLLVDWRITYLDQGCSAGDPQLGVPLARVVLQRDAVAKRCSVHYIDTAAPYRRELQLDRWPAPAGMFNLGQLVWQRVELAGARLCDLGCAPNLQQVQFRTPHELRDALDEEWPKDALRSKLAEPKIGLFLDVSGKRSQLSSEQLQVAAVQFNAGGLPAGNRVLSFGWQSGFHPPATQQDVLASIHGIGEERAARLRLEGITTFAQLAASDVGKIEAMFPIVELDEIKSWLKEARLRAATGE